MQDNAAEAVFKPSVTERMIQTDATFRAMISAEMIKRQEKTRRLRLARQSMAETEQ